MLFRRADEAVLSCKAIDRYEGPVPSTSCPSPSYLTERQELTCEGIGDVDLLAIVLAQ